MPNNDTRALITKYPNNPEFGYVHLQQSTRVINGGFVTKKKRSCLLRGRIEDLADFVKESENGTVPGNICVQEYLESQIPANIYRQIFNSEERSYEDSVKSYVKRAGNDGPELTFGGERIIRYAFYDEAGESLDIHVAHDNIEAVAAYNATRSAANAALPD